MSQQSGRGHYSRISIDRDFAYISNEGVGRANLLLLLDQPILRESSRILYAKVASVWSLMGEKYAKIPHKNTRSVWLVLGVDWLGYVHAKFIIPAAKGM